MDSKRPATAFLKWAGGKRWLTAAANSQFPKSFDRYLEPFLGSGAVFFHLNPQSAVLSDTNADLVTTYRAIANDPKSVQKKLRAHQRSHSKEYYYLVRRTRYRSESSIAAKFIYLNRTCWNGLYRVNQNGQFNVPIGTKTNVLLDTDDFETTAVLLKRAKIYNQDFSKTLAIARSGDFFFVDPPYTVKHNHNGFIKYNENLFSWHDQERLLDCLIHVHRKGGNFLLTHANHPSICRLFGRYFEYRVVKRASVIAANKSFRGRTEELLIKNY